MKEVNGKNFRIGKGQPLTLISGPCVIEGEEEALKAAEFLKNLMSGHPVQYIYKSSYDKANRSSIKSYRGPGLQEGLRILEKIGQEFDLPVLTDVHSPEEAKAAGEVVDILQVPAFLCRQTDLLVAAAETGKPVQVKKGQFMAPWDMKNVINKLKEGGCDQVILVERGASFGYNNLVSDMRAIPMMQKLGYPVCYDASHSVQLPGELGESSGGQSEYILLLARAALAAGANALFMEAHPDPDKAKCDAASQLSFPALEEAVGGLVKLYQLVQETFSR